MNLFVGLACIILLGSCSFSRIQYRLDTTQFVHQIPFDLIRNMNVPAAGFRVAWKSSLGWEWRVLSYEIHDALSRADLLYFNEKTSKKSVVHFENTTELTAIHTMLATITEKQSILSSSLTGVNDGLVIYIAHQVRTSELVQIWNCDVTYFRECVDLEDLLRRIDSTVVLNP